MEGKKYERGMNMAGETAGQVANYMTADLRVVLRDRPEVVDALQESIARALREAAFANENAHMKAMEHLSGWTSLTDRAECWSKLFEVATLVYPDWHTLGSSGYAAMVQLVRRGGEFLVNEQAKVNPC